MATKKSKTSTKSEKTKSTKSKTATKTADKTEVEAPKTTKVESKSSSDKKSCLSGFFAKKYDENEGILTVFKSHKFYGSLLGEIIGTMLIALLLFSVSLMGIASAAT